MITAFHNPVSSQTIISFNLELANYVTLVIYNIQGKEIEILTHSYQSAGNHELLWQTEGLPGGTYLAVIQSGGHVDTLEILLT